MTTPSVSDAHAVQGLHGWLVRSADLDADITQASSATGHMGALDVIDVVLTHAVAAANLVIAYTAWRRARPDAPPITFTVNGVTVTAADASPETVERIRATLLAALPRPPAPSPSPSPGDDAA
ncbi:hypothetical protein AB0K00_55875 [Dactylosporangium sp. NPDC049525]|uniref:effector-associated constant component EACC1 n=1 Tax=Dactylosporangium sp. NPDC049525 TaxID=3154730 RepID=UPI0034293C77